MDKRLTEWFLEAKHSLSIAGPICTEANGLVATSRKQIEKATVLWSQIMFLHSAISEQLDMLENVQSSIEDFKRYSKDEFEISLRDLNGSEKRLTTALVVLDNIELDGALYKQKDEPQSKKIRSFVYEKGLTNLKEMTKECKGEVGSMQDELSKTVMGYSKSIASLRNQMFSVKAIKKESLEHANEGTNLIANHAHAMAMLLESLARHYDQCLKAIEMNDSSNNEPKVELLNLYEVLENDSKEVEGVVLELEDRNNSIQVSEKSVSEFYQQMQKMHKVVVKYFNQLELFGNTNLPSTLESIDDYSKKQKVQVEKVSKLIEEISSLTDYYEMFSKSYHAMVLEILRRSDAQSKLETYLDDVAKTLNKLHQEELDARKTFLDERGDFLPIDLWPGLTASPRVPKISLETTEFPKLSEKTITNAIKEIRL